MSNKYESGYNLQKEKELEIEKRAGRQAEFYLTKISEIKNEVIDEEQIRLIHFFNDPEAKRNHIIENRSPLYDCDRDWLNKIGLDIKSMDAIFDNEIRYLVAIPADNLEQWVNTKSWLKLSYAETLNNAVIFSVPRKKLIFREHDFVEQSFLQNDKTGKLAKKYYESTNKKMDDLRMQEAWFRDRVPFSEKQLLQYQEKE